MRKADYVSKLIAIAQSDDNNDSIDVRIAQVMLQHLKDLGNMQNQELAQKCYVDASTVSRFVRSLGFLKYGEFKSYFKEYNEIHDESYYFDFTKLPTKEEMLESMIQSLNNSFELINEKDVEKTIQLIQEYGEILLGGDRYSQLVAQDFQMKLLSLGYYAKTYQDVVLQMNELERTKGLFILFSASYSKSKAMVKIAKKQGWKVVLITRNKEVMDDVDVVILFDDKNVSNWTVHSVNDRFCMQMVVDQIILKLATKKLQVLQ